MIWKRLFYASAGLTLLFMAAAIFFYFSDGPSPDSDSAFEPNGTTSNGVLQALVHTGRLTAMPSDATSAPARAAIKKAEREFGLLADGFPDQTLLDQLIAGIETKSREPSATEGWTLDSLSILVTIISGIVTLILQVLTHFRGSAKSDPQGSG